MVLFNSNYQEKKIHLKKVKKFNILTMKNKLNFHDCFICKIVI